MPDSSAPPLPGGVTAGLNFVWGGITYRFKIMGEGVWIERGNTQDNYLWRMDDFPRVWLGSNTWDGEAMVKAIDIYEKKRGYDRDFNNVPPMNPPSGE